MALTVERKELVSLVLGRVKHTRKAAKGASPGITTAVHHDHYDLNDQDDHYDRGNQDNQGDQQEVGSYMRKLEVV